MAELSPLAQVEQDQLRRQARRILAKDGVNRGNIDVGPATAQAVLETPSAETHTGEWEQMSRTEQALNTVEGNWHNRQKSGVYAEFVDAIQSADAGYSAYTDDIDGTDDESRQAVADLLSKDTQANRDYKAQQLERARAAYDEYNALSADDYKYHTPADIKRMMEATKGKGFWEGLTTGASELLSGDILGNAIYLGGSLGAIAPELALGALGGMAGGALGGARLANAARAVVMAYGSYDMSYGSKMAEMLKERGIDVGDFEATRKNMMQRGAEVEDLKYRASNYATGVALFDGIAGYAASLKMNPTEVLRKLSTGAKKAKTIGGRIGDELGNIAAQSGAQAVLGGAGEAAGTLAAGEELDAGEVLLEMLGEFTTAPIEVAQAGVSTSLAYRRDQANAQLAEAEKQLMENIVAVSEASAVALGNEETVTKWAQRLGEGKEVMAFAQDLVTNGELEKLAEVDPQLAEQVKQAAEEGTTVTMPVGKIAEIAIKDKALAQEMIQDCRLSVDGMSPRQAEEFKKNGLDEATKLFDKTLKSTKATVEQFASAHKVAQRLKDDLIAAGTDRNVAAAQVKPLEMHLARLAGQLGIVPENLAEELNLRVEKNGQGVNDIAYTSARADDSARGMDTAFHQLRTKPAPTKTKKIYKLMRINRNADGSVWRDEQGRVGLFPLYIGRANPIFIGEWHDAESPDFSLLQTLPNGIHLVNNETGEHETFEEYFAREVAPTLTGQAKANYEKDGKLSRAKPNRDDINAATKKGLRFIAIRDAKGSDVSKATNRYGDPRRYYTIGLDGTNKYYEYAMRAGWHGASAPTMHQTGSPNKDAWMGKYRPTDEVWVEGEVPDDVDWSSKAAQTVDGDLATEMPVDGYYNFETNPIKSKSKGLDWVIAGAFKPTRILSDAEARAEVDRQNREEFTRSGERKEIVYDFYREGGVNFNAESFGYDEPQGFAQSGAEDYSEYLNYEPKVTSTGKITGAPEWVNNEADLKKMRRDLVKFVKEGESGRFWYEDTARAVMTFVGGDIGLADKMAQLLAIYSPQSGIGPNALMAVRAYTHWAMGLPAETFSVKTKSQDKKAIDVLYNDKPWDGRKTNSFYTNIMYEVVKNDPEGARAAGVDVEDVLGGRATIDLWMLRAFGYNNEAASDDKAQGKYSFSENETRRLTARLNKALPKGAEPWTPHQVQAAIWTAVKTRYEVPEVKAKTNRKSHREGLVTKTGNTFSYNKMSPEQTRAHHANWRHFAMQPSSKEIKAMAETVGRSFAHEFERQSQIVTWEANPSTALGYAINNASPAVMRMFTDEANGIFRDENGNDLLAKLVGVALSSDAQGDGGYGGGVSPNILSRLIPTSVTGQKGISREEVRKYARALQYIFKQDAVPFFRFENKPLSASEQKEQRFKVVNPNGRTVKTFETQAEATAYAANKGEGFKVRGGKLAKGVVFKFNKDLDAETQKAFLDKINAVLGDDVGFTRFSENELVVINFRDDETHLPFLATDEDFIKKLSDLQFEEGELAEVRQTWTEGEYGYWHDWSADSEGQAILQLLGADNADNQGNVRGDSRGDSEGRERTSAQLVRWRNDYEELLQKYSPEYIQALEQGFQNYRNAEEVAFQQRAYSGGRAKHTKFLMDYVGSGMGTRVQGWGMYFTSTLGVAERYRNDAVYRHAGEKADAEFFVNGQDVLESDDEIEQEFFEKALPYFNKHPKLVGTITAAQVRSAIKFVNKAYDEMFERFEEVKSVNSPDSPRMAKLSADMEARKETRKKVIEYANALADGIKSRSIELTVSRAGRTFSVEIPENEELLDWDKPIAEQSDKVKAAIKKLAESSYANVRVASEDVAEGVVWGNQSVVADVGYYGNVSEEYVQNEIIKDFAARLIEGTVDDIETEALYYSVKAQRTNGSTVTKKQERPAENWSWVDELDDPLGLLAEENLPEVNRDETDAENLRNYIGRLLERAQDLVKYRYPQVLLASDTGRTYYQRLSEHLSESIFSGDKAASLMLNDYGIQGITYADDKDYTTDEYVGGDRGFVIFNDEAIQILDYWQGQQKTRGSYVPANTATDTTGLSGVITLMENADKSTFMHESAHFFLDIDTMLASRIADKYARGEDLTEGEKEFLTNLGGFFQWGQREGVINLGVVDGDLESVMRAARQWSQLSMNEQRAMHELFAEGFESYLMTGQAPNNSVRNLFARFKEWLIDVYATATKQPRPISKDVEKLYSLMFATAQEVQEVETANGMTPLFALEDEREEEEAKQKGVKLTKEERAAFRKLHKEAQLEAQGIVTKAISGVVGYYVKLRDSAARKIIKEQKKRVDDKIKALLEEPRYVAYDILTNGLIRGEQKLKFKLSPESLRAEGYSQETIDALDKKGLLYGRERKGLLSPNRLAEMCGAEDAEALMTDLAEGTKAKAKSPLSKARDFLGWSGGLKLSVRELKAAGIKDEVIAKLIDRGVAYDSSLRADTCSAEQLAEMCGHDSAVDLIAELVDIQEPRIEAASWVAAQIQMETGETPEVYTDLQANLAAHNKARSRFLHAEYNAIARMLGQRQLAVYAAREYAKTKIEGVRLKDARASAYIAAERRCARDAERAFIAGDYQACLNAKRGQILNHEMARVALEVEDKVEKARRAARRALKSKGLYKPYQRLLARLVAAHDLTAVSDKLLRQQDNVKELIAELENDGTPIEGLEDALADSKPLSEMGVEEANNYLSVVKELTAVARGRQRQNLMETKARISDIVEEGTELLNAAADAQGRGEQLTETPKGKWDKALETAKGMFFGHVKAQAMCRIFDQNKENGFFWNLFIRSANKCADFEDSERAKTANKLEEILAPLFGKRGAFDVDKQRIGKKMMSKGERFAAACNMGNESNFKRLIEGDPKQWTEENIKALQQSLTAEEWQAVQAVWDLLESYRPMIAEKQKRVYGEEPEWIEPQELTVETADGQTLTLRGGYYPVKYDPYSSNKADRQEDAKLAAQELRGAFQSATTNRSFTKSRVKNPNVGPLRLDMDALFSGLNDVIHDLAWHEWLIETRRVLNGVNGEDSGLRKVIRDRYGYHAAKLFEAWRMHIAEGDRIDSHPIWNYLAGKAGVSLMGWSPMSAIVQLTGIGYIVPRCGAKSTLKALGLFLKSPMESRRAINDVSSLMKNRALTANRHVAEIRSKLNSGNEPWYKKHAYSMLLAVQSIADSICWMAAYDKAMSDPKVLNDIDPDKAAIAVADQAVIDTQSSGRISDSADFENEGHLKALTVFYTWANAALNQSFVIYKSEQDRLAAWQKLVWMGLLMPTVEKLFRDMLRPDDEDDDEEFETADLFRVPLSASLEYHLGLFVGVREMANAAGAVVAGEPTFGYNGPAGTRGAAAGTKLLQSATSVANGNGWSMVTAGIDAAGALTGIPSAQINRTIKGIRAIESGQAEGMDALLAPVFGFSGRIKD